MLFDSHFLTLLELPELLALVDHTVSDTAILHLQNGFVLPSLELAATPETFANNMHQDFRRVLNGYLASINVLICVSDFTVESGATQVVPGSHQKEGTLDSHYAQRNAVSVECPAGSFLVFDSTLWHAAGRNTSGKDRLAINNQFTRSFIKQQIDYPRALGQIGLDWPSRRTQQILGYWTRVPSSLEEYYVPPEKRLYRANQG